MPHQANRILVVDDNELVRDHAAGLLRSHGYDVVSVANGVDALAALRETGTFQLLFTDMVMPGSIDGHQLALEAHKLRPAMPVLFTSGYLDGPGGGPNSSGLGVHFLIKPYRRQELAARVRQAIAEGVRV